MAVDEVAHNMALERKSIVSQSCIAQMAFWYEELALEGIPI